MASHDKHLLVKQLFELINFDLLREGKQIQKENSCGESYSFRKNYFITLDLLPILLLSISFLIIFS